VVDFSSFPGFKGVPDAPRLLADHIWEVAHRPLDSVPELHAPDPSVGPVIGRQPTMAAR
jgi:hypothetical protein